MLIGNIVLAMRQADTMFGEYIFGAAEVDAALKGTFTLSTDSAFVVPTGDIGGANTHDNGIVQSLTERFSVITATRNDTKRDDYQGIQAYNLQHDVRKELWKALLGRYFTEDVNKHNNYPIEYVGSNIIGINGAYLWWQYDFTYSTDIRNFGNDGADGYDPDDAALPTFDKIHADIIMTPSFKFETLGDTPIPLDADTTDSAQDIDLTTDPKGGSFWFGFGNGFNKLQK